MTQSLGDFKATNKMKNFHMVHCWVIVKYCPKWHELYAAYDANAKAGKSNVIDVDGVAPSEASASKRPRGWISSKAEATRDASSQEVMKTIKILLADKEVSEKRNKRKHWEKEEAVKNCVRYITQEACC
jgi:hypothetical protein